MNMMEAQKLKEIEKQILIEFITICQRHNLQYFLLGGTALGAVRHKGFIPWDDDIDVALPREDYLKFLEYASAELPAHLFLQSAETDFYYPANFAKIRNSDTTFVEKAVKDFHINHGVYIDIFPLDGTSDNSGIRALHFQLLRLINVCMSDIYYIPERQASWKGKVSHIIHKLFPFKYTTLRDWREKLMQRYPYKDAAVIANFCGAWEKKEIMPKAVFGKGTISVFEGLEVVLPENWDEYLTRLYGDYMTPPPVEKRKGHHDYTVLDLDKSYINYI